MVTNRQSFANALSEPGEDRFFVHWKSQYKVFQTKISELFDEDNRWLTETDAAAFYETIDHQLLKRVLVKNDFLDNITAEYLESCLSYWSSVNKGELAYRGIPQGCLASDLLANVFLFEFDSQMASKEYHYLRYVDDIRVLGKTKEDVQRGLIDVDIGLKARSILLQTKKTTVREIINIALEIDRLATQLSEIDQRLKEPEPIEVLPNDPLLEPSLHDIAILGDDINDLHIGYSTVQEELQDIFWEAKRSIDKGRDKDDDPFAERHLRFCLYRLEPDIKIVNAVLPYFVEKPWLSEIIATYLRKCTLDTPAINALHKIIAEHNVYDSVVALAIDVLIKQKISLRQHNSKFRQWLTYDKRSWLLLCNAAIALGEASDNMTILFDAMKSNSASVRRMAVIQALRLSRNLGEATRICQNALQDDSPLVIDTTLYLLYNEHGLSLSQVNSNFEKLKDYCIICARGYDITLPNVEHDYIKHILSKNYSVNFSSPVNFRILLGVNYDRASQFLWQAEKSYLADPSRYVSQLNLFHEELLYPIVVDLLKLKPTREDLSKVELSNRFDLLHKNAKQLATLVSAMLRCNELRANPETHSRLHQQLTETSPILPQQRDSLKKSLKAGYQQLADWIIATNYPN